jgi:hypothetical protein
MVAVSLSPESAGGERSQGGVKVPTGGDGDLVASARERSTGQSRRGQQSRCNSDADGHSPDERERVNPTRALRSAPPPVRPDSQLEERP